MASTSSWRRLSTTLAMSFPVAVWISDSLISFYTVRGTSMEPCLQEGDVVLVRKADLIPVLFSDYAHEHQNMTTRARILRYEGEQRSPIIARPPMVLPGDVVVFCSPSVPNRYDVKRVMGVGGQMIRPGDRFRNIEIIPSYNLWVEGDTNSEGDTTSGPISKKLLLGQAQYVVWPPPRWGRVKKVAPPPGRAWWA